MTWSYLVYLILVSNSGFMYLSHLVGVLFAIIRQYTLITDHLSILGPSFINFMNTISRKVAKGSQGKNLIKLILLLTFYVV